MKAQARARNEPRDLQHTGDSKMSEEKWVLRWGGLAGMLGVILAILSIIILLAFVPAQPAGPCGPACYLDASVAAYPAERAALTVGHVLYLSAITLFIILFLALYRALRGGGSLAPALFGRGIGILGLALLAAGAMPSVAFAHLSDAYHTPGATPQDQATLALVSHAVQAIFNETDTVGGILLTVGFILMGIAMLRNPAFGKRLGGVSILLGLAALVGISLISVAQDNPNDFAFVILVVVLPLLLGWKLYRLAVAAQQV